MLKRESNSSVPIPIPATGTECVLGRAQSTQHVGFLFKRGSPSDSPSCCPLCHLLPSQRASTQPQPTLRTLVFWLRSATSHILPRALGAVKKLVNRTQGPGGARGKK